MKTSQAPLYILSYDLARWLLERVEQFPRARRIVYGDRLRSTSLELLECVSVALAFPGVRQQRLQQADEALLHLRLALRLATDSQTLSAKQSLFVQDQVEVIGRMLGGWRKKELNKVYA